MDEDYDEFGPDCHPWQSLSPLAFALWATRDDALPRVTDGKFRQPHLEGSYKRKLGKYVAIDCECVGVAPRLRSALARVSIVNFYGVTHLDVYVKPNGRVTDWRTWVSGITPKHMKHAISYDEAQKLVAEIIDGRTLVGHSVSQDLNVLGLSHPEYLTEDISQYPYFRNFVNGKTPGLRTLSNKFLDHDIQGGSHSLVEDALATMALFRVHNCIQRRSRRS